MLQRKFMCRGPVQAMGSSDSGGSGMLRAREREQGDDARVGRAGPTTPGSLV